MRPPRTPGARPPGPVGLGWRCVLAGLAGAAVAYFGPQDGWSLGLLGPGYLLLGYLLGKRWREP